MKLTQKFTGVVLATFLFVGAVQMNQMILSAPIHAEQVTNSVQKRALSKPYVVYGAGAVQKTQIAQTLGINDNYKKLVTTGADARYIGLNGVSDSAMISSVSLAPAEPGTGALVNIEPFEGKHNITKVTAQQYAMAATMAGVDDVIITVTADKPVSGEAALAGVYKALDADGISLNPTNTNAANSVLEATSQAVDAQGNQGNYASKLTSAVTTTSSELAKRKQEGNQIDINVIINQLTVNLEQNGIRDRVSDEDISQIAGALQNVNNAPISDSKAFVKNSSNLADKLSKSSGNVMAKAKDFANSKDAHNASNWFVANIWQPFLNMVNAFLQWLTHLI